MTPEEVAKVRELLTHEDAEIQNQGLELAKSFGDYSAVFEGCSIDEEGRIQLSFGSHQMDFRSLNNAILEGFIESGVVDPQSVARMRTTATEGYTNWACRIKRGSAVLNLTPAQYPKVWTRARRLVELSRNEEAGDLLTSYLKCYYVNEYFEEDLYLRAVTPDNEESVSRYLELISGENLEEVVDQLSVELEEVDAEDLGISGCGFAAESPVVTAVAEFKITNRLKNLCQAVRVNGGSIEGLELGISFQWSSDLFENAELCPVLTESSELNMYPSDDYKFLW